MGIIQTKIKQITCGAHWIYLTSRIAGKNFLAGWKATPLSCKKNTDLRYESIIGTSREWIHASALSAIHMLDDKTNNKKNKRNQIETVIKWLSHLCGVEGHVIVVAIRRSSCHWWCYYIHPMTSSIIHII